MEYTGTGHSILLEKLIKWNKHLVDLLLAYEGAAEARR